MSVHVSPRFEPPLHGEFRLPEPHRPTRAGVPQSNSISRSYQSVTALLQPSRKRRGWGMRSRLYSSERARPGVSADVYPGRTPYPARCRAARAAAAAAGTAPNAAARTSAAPATARDGRAPAPTARDRATAAAAAATAAPSAPLGDLRPERRRDRAFPVEHIERRQADVGDLFFSKRELRRSGNPRRRVSGRCGCCRCAARQRQRCADESYHRYDFFRMFSLRSALRVRHSPVLPRLLANVSKSGTGIRTLCLCTWQGQLRWLHKAYARSR